MNRPLAWFLLAVIPFIAAAQSVRFDELALDAAELARLYGLGLIGQRADRLWLKPKGRLLADYVAKRLTP